jgi:Fe-S oxidoreductase
MRCQWIDFESKDAARAEIEKMINGEDSHVLSDCATCFACDEYCPYDSHPFDLIVQLQEKYNSHNIDPSLLNITIKQFEPHKELRIKDIDPDNPVLNQCAFVKTNAKNMQGQLFDMQYVAGRDFFCNLVYHHFDRDAIIRERVVKIRENIVKQNIKEMICFHDECYGLWASYCPRNNIEVPFKPIHLFEYLYNYLKEHESDIKKLNMKVAYQRNCSNRFIPETDEYLDKIFDLIGVERVDRKYDRENALCCGGPLSVLGKGKLTRPTQEKNIEDMLSHNVEACVYNCPFCMDTLKSKVKKKGLKNYLVSDLCRLALGEEL